MKNLIGLRCKVKGQDITGVITRHDIGNKVYVMDDFPEWATEEDTGELIFNISDLDIFELDGENYNKCNTCGDVYAFIDGHRCWRV